VSSVASNQLDIDLGPRQDRARFEWGSVWFLGPALVLMAVLFLGPIVYSLYLAFTNLQLAGPNAVHYGFTGLTNVRRLFNDTEFTGATKLTIYFLVGSAIVGQSVLGMVLALLMRRVLAPLRIVVGAVIVLAWVLPEVTAAFVWYAFSQPGGTLSNVLGHANTNYIQAAPMLMVCISNAWRNVAFSMLMFSAALRNLPNEVIEAAEMEGAGVMRRLFFVVIPMMRGTIFTNLLLVTLGNLSTFTLIWVMTQGGPGNATSILPVYMYLVAFNFNDLGYGSMIGLALIALGALFAITYVYSLRTRIT
jgi:multiple sugar transport system permease protein